MKRDEWIVILIVVVGGGLIVILALSGVNYCWWSTWKNYNMTVSSKEQAASMLTSDLKGRINAAFIIGNGNVTASEITVVGDDFVDYSRDIKISKDGVVSEWNCLAGY